MPRNRLVSIATVALAAGAVSCAAILGFEQLSTEGGFIIDAGGTDADASSEDATIQPDAAVDAPSPAPGCDQLGIPDRPLDASAESLPPVHAALSFFDFGIDADGGRPDVPGFNLDKACSTSIATSTCATSVLDSVFTSYAADKTATGVDNAGFALIQYINGFSSLLSKESLNDGLTKGRYGAVVRLMDWNGQPDDDTVRIEIFPAIGVVRGDGGTERGRDDRWVLDARFEVAPGVSASTIKSTEAWINGGRLVAKFASATLPLLVADDPKPFDMKLADVILTATVATEGNLTAFHDGVVAGRWKTSEFLDQVRNIYVKNGSGIVNKTLCDDDTTVRIVYGAVKKEICDGRDIRSDSQDRAAPKLPCDALSAAMRIDSYPVVNLGVFEAGKTIAPRCVDAGPDDCP